MNLNNRNRILTIAAGVSHVAALLLLMYAIILVTVTFATSDYRPILSQAMWIALVSACCFGVAAACAKPRRRWFVLITSLPLVYVILEIFRRW